MNKLFNFGLYITIVCMLASCKTTSELEKARARQGKVAMENLKRGGWEMNDRSRSLEVAILEHQEKLKSSANQGMSVTITCKIMSNCDLAARTEAARKYAQQAGSFVEEKTSGDNHLDQGNLDTEFSKLYSGYVVWVQKEIQGEITPSFDVVRRHDGVNEYQAYFIVNEDRASAARLKAMERAFAETKLAQQYANQVAEFVREGFPIKD